MERMEPKRQPTSPIPLIHTRNYANPSKSGGYYKQPSLEHLPGRSSIPNSLLLIDSKDKYHVREGFGASAPQKKKLEPPKLLAANAMFVEPYVEPPTPVEDAETQTEPQIFFKKEMESMNDYQEWISQKVDPITKKIRLALIQSKPEDIPEFLQAYMMSLINDTAPPSTIDRDDYRREQRNAHK
mmetsp:Transcript_6074/g.9174  ORF Transcript_6074/g.9174 Transcript_6074/m.9174 type:complete len:184 (+) Transcript_6074:84-635(+)|eukprot:CAMPEP_0185027246 /NCGR_PEP_ID=MMETSP1103-20130426/12050_1 /TAXON_ID=36769 /ORGANISM="Paraphysomonas bandaiensis, Strain Caron Lab Isolate" /LENGTH=183 /DNA_ID=CAMNT_0027561143 /DNA_START=36 /DNA_END=587 /DNA_ORIENTATION=-